MHGMLRITIIAWCCVPASLSFRTAAGSACDDPAPQVQAPAPRTTFANVRGESPEYRLGAGDVLEIHVVDAPELNQTIQVSVGGDINFLPVGGIPVAGLTAAEAEDRIAAALKERRLVREPQVLIFIREYKAKRVYVLGELVFPGEFVMSQSLTVMDAILLAGGLGPYPPRYGYLHHHISRMGEDRPPPASVLARPDAPREGTEIFKIDLQPFLEGKSPQPDLALQHGDYLIIPREEVEFFYVLGEVMNPLYYVYPTGRKLMVSQAIAQAGGPTMAAKTSQTIISRKDSKGKRQELKVDFASIIQGKKPDIEIYPEDVVYVPSSKLTIMKEDYITKTDLIIEGTAFRMGRYYQLPPEGRQAAGFRIFR